MKKLFYLFAALMISQSLFAQPEINVKGRNVTILSGDTSPATDDNTSFNRQYTSGATTTQTFTIENIGTTTLTLTGNPSVTGTNSGDFTVTTNPSLSILAGGSTTFSIRFDPSATGTRTATVTVNNNDTSEGAYTFTISGIGQSTTQVRWVNNQGESRPSTVTLDGVTYPVFANTYTDIQSAINAAVTDDIVYITNGLYRNPNEATSNSCVFSGTGQQFNLYLTIENKGITLTSETGNHCTSDARLVGYGIFTDNAANTQIQGLHLDSVRVNGFWDTNFATGSPYSQSGNLKIRNNKISNTRGHGIKTDTGGPTGVPINRGAWDITGNYFENIGFYNAMGDCPTPSPVTAIWLGEAGNSFVISNNIIDNTKWAGILCDGYGGYQSMSSFPNLDGAVTISGNRINRTVDAGIQIGFSSGTPGYYPTNAYITHNTITNANTGQSLGSGAITVLSSNVKGKNITYNDVSTSFNGLAIDIAGWESASAANPTYVNYNNFYSLTSGSFGVTHKAGISPNGPYGTADNLAFYNFENNYWGAANGPTYATNPSGTGVALRKETVAVSGVVYSTGDFDFTPYSTTANTVSSASLSCCQIPTAGISYSGSPFSTNGSTVSVNRTGTPTGTFTSSPAGLNLNGDTGLITPSLSTPGTYTVTYLVAASGSCNAVTATASVTIVSPEMNVKGNNTSIPDGDTDPTTADNTDFGSTLVSGGTVIRNFIIENTGAGALTLSGSPIVAVSGTNASEFTVTQLPTSPVAATNGTTTFQVTFNPAATGLRTATVSIVNNDSDENPYNFSIQGTGSTTCSQIATANATMTWTGMVSTDWANTCNWSPNGVPGAGNTVVIPNTANDPTISSFTANVLQIHIQSGGQLTVNNTGVLNVTQFTSPGFTLDASTLTNSGTINLNSTAANISAMNVNSGSTVTNTGTINVTSGYGITNGSGATFNNNSCGRIILTSSNNNDFRNEGGTFTNAGLLQVYWWLHNTGTITNNGVLKYETLNNSGTLTNNRILIDDNEVPFFTIGAGNNATINGVFTDAAAMTSAGNYIQASNAFTPSPSLPGGLQTLYAKVTLSGGSCVLIVPFLYTNNIPLPVITSNPASKAVCAGLSTSFSITATGATSYQWELSTNGGSAWTNVPNSAPYSNVTTTTLNISDVTGLNNNRYRCVATNGGGSVESTGAILTVNTPTATPTGTITWLGAVSTDWNTACNWSPASVPGSGNKVVIPNTPNDPVVGTTVTVLQVKLQANAQLTVNSGASLAVTIGNDYGFIFESNTAFTNNGTTTAQPSSGNMYAAFYAEDATNVTITNNGTISAQNFNAGFGAFQSSMTITNAANATINLSGNGSGFTTYSNVGTQQLTNNGTINYAGTDRVFNGVKGSAINNGLIQATSGLGILSIHTFSLTNAACAKFILTAGDFHTNPTTTTINNGYFYVAGELASGPFTNNGVLKYGTLLLSITNTAASAVIVNNSGPIFTYGVSGSSYTGTVNGIFTDLAATASAGTYTQATNTFTPLGTLPAGSQTLYAKITPSGGGCFYVVPFTYNNVLPPTITAGATTNSPTCGGNGSIAFITTNVPDGTYLLYFTPTGAGATTSPQNVTVTNNAFTLTVKRGSYNSFSITVSGQTATTGVLNPAKSIFDPAPFALPGISTPTTTCGGTDGSIQFTGAGTGIPDGTYSMSFTATGAGATTSPQNITVSANAFTLSGLSAGTYNNFAMTVLGCSSLGTIPKTISNPPNPIIEAGTVVNPVTCGGTGFIPFTTTFLPSGTYSLSFTATGAGATTSPQNVTIFGTSFSLSNLKAGTYSNFSITSTNNCTGSTATSITVSNPPTPTLTVESTTNPTSCSGTDGSIAFTSTNLPNFNYSLSFTATGAGATASPQNVTVSGNAFTLSGLKAGTYSNFSVTRANCTGTEAASRTLTDPAIPTLIAGAVTNPLTCGGTGSIAFATENLPDNTYTLHYKKGTTAQTASITVSANGFLLSGLTQGLYSDFSITNVGCTGSDNTTKTLTDPTAPITPTGSVTVQPTCTTPTGTIVVTAPTGTDIQYSVNGTDYQSETTFAGLAPNSYSVTAKNTTTGCVSSPLSLTVNAVPGNPATPTASVTAQPTCTTPTGSIVITAPTGMDIQYSVNGTDYQSETTFAGLAPNSYSVTAKNTTTGCISSPLSLTVNAVPGNPATPTASVTTQPTCTTPTGTIVITAPTGTDIQYSVNGTDYQSETTFAGLAPNSYSVTAKNTTTGCISSPLSLTVNAVPGNPATPTASVTTQPTCTTPTGTIVITAPTGTDIQYSVNGTDYQSETTFAGLAPNSYSVTAKNTTTGCISSPLSLTVNAVPGNPATPTASVTAQPTCTTPTGTIVITAPTGTNIQYSVNGTDYQSETTFAGLAPNSYSVTAKNTTTGCISQALSLTVNAVPGNPATPTASVTAQPTCTTPAGTIVITAPTGTDIQYSVNGTDYQSETTFAGLAPNSYSVTAKNTTTGCISQALSLTVNAVPGNPATPTASVTAQPTCTTPTGTIVITAPTGTDIQYSINGTDYQPLATFSALAPNTNYSVTAKNTTTGCISQALSLTVNAVPGNPATPTASVTAQPTCTTPTGTIVITAPTGTDIQYSINGTDYQSETTFAGLAPNSYSVTAKNTTTGCISSPLSLTVNAVPGNPTTPTASVTAQPTCTTPTGTIVITAPTGTDIQYSINGTDYQPLATFSALAPNTNYSVTAKNTTTGCISQALSLTVNAVPGNPATPTASVTAQPTCTTPTGTIVITAPTGTNIQYSVNGTDYQSETTFAGLAPNSYSVTAKNTTTGCVSSPLSLTVNAVPGNPATPTASVTAQPTCTTPTGTIVVTAPTGTNIQYSVNGTDYQSETTFAGLAPNSYSVTAKNTTTGCISSPLSLTVNAVPGNPATPTASVTTQPTCTTPTGTIVITAPTGTDIQYSVNGTDYQSETTFAGLAPNSYSVTAKNTTTGCISSPLSLTVNAVPGNPATPTASVTTQPTCTTPTGTIVITAPTGTDIQYSVNGTDYQSETTFAGLAPNSYSVTAKNTTTGCISQALSLTVNAVPGNPATTTASVTAQPTCTTPTGTIVITAPTGSDIQYSLNGTDYQTETDFNGLAPNTNYSVTAKNTTTGCISQALSLTVNAVPGNPATPTASVTAQPTCTTPTGTIVVTAPTGTDIQYSINGTDYQTETDFNGLNPNTTYSVTAKNTTTGCVSSPLSLTVNAVPGNPATPTASVTAQPTCTTPTGSIVITAPTGSDIQYSVNGTDYQTETAFNGLNPNTTYSVTAKNTTTGCISQALSLTVNAVPGNPATPTASVTAQPNCTTPTGSIVITAPTGSDIQYSLNGTDYQTETDFNGLNPNTTYSVTAKNTTTGCISQALSLTVNAIPGNPATPTASVTAQPNCTTPAGTIVITAPTGSDIQYSLNGTDYQTETDFNGLNPNTTYSVTAKNTTTGCISQALSLTVNAVPGNPATPTASVTAQPTCTTPTGSIVITAPTGMDIQYSVNGTDYQSETTFAGLAPNSYSVTAKNTTTGCISQALSLTVNAIPSVFTLSFTGKTHPTTCGGNNGSLTFNTTGLPNANYTLNYSDGSAQSANVTVFNNQFTLSGLRPGSYTDFFLTYGICSGSYETPAILMANPPLPEAFSLTGGGVFCENSNGLEIALSGSQIGIQYQLKIQQQSIGNPIPGNGKPISFGLHNQAGSYSVTATSIATNCAADMSGIAILTTYPLPTDVALSGGGISFCQTPLSILMESSQAGVSYQLKRNNVNLGNPIQGTGTPLVFSGLTQAGTYSIVATTSVGNCTRTLSDEIIIQTRNAPTAYNLIGGGASCSGSPVNIQLSNSQIGVLYQLKRANNPVGSPVQGTGNALAFPPQNTPGTYTVVALTQCADLTMNNTVTVTAVVTPNTFQLTGGGTSCGTALPVGLSDSQSGVFYQLLRNNTPVGTTVQGTGQPITLGNHLTQGQYTIVATRAGQCPTTMQGSALINIIDPPALFNVIGGGTACPAGVPISLSGSQSGMEYQLKRGNTLVSTQEGDGNSLSFPNQTVAGTYTVEAISEGNCSRTMSATAIVTSAGTLPNLYSMTGGGPLCNTTTLALGLSDSQRNVAYQLQRNTPSGFVNVGTSVQGTGSALALGNHSVLGEYRVVVNSACLTEMTNRTSITACNARIATDADPSHWRTDGMSNTFAQVMPNPVSKTLHLKVSEAKGQKVNVSLLDAAGRVMMQRAFVPETNQHQEEFEVSDVANGMYFMQVKTTDKQATLKVVKVE